MPYKPCAFGRCTSVVEVFYDGQHYCTVHRPEKLLERVREIVTRRCEATTYRNRVALRDAILADLEDTV